LDLLWPWPVEHRVLGLTRHAPRLGKHASMSSRVQTVLLNLHSRSGFKRVQQAGEHDSSRADNLPHLVIPKALQPARNLLFKILPTTTARQYAQFFAGSLAVLGSLLLLRSANPATSGVFPPCPFLWLTGWYCPGCGSLRALHQLLAGNLTAACAFNPFAVLSFPFLAYAAVSRTAFLLRGRYRPRVFLPGWFIWTLGAAIITFGILRNLPIYPFHLLAPGAMLTAH
jgi:Protein of unknown function (DUF2752)